MSKGLKELCEEQGLHYVETADLAIRRRRCGKGFSYLNSAGTAIRDKRVKARFRSLAIPPAWTDVCIAEDAAAHIQAIGRDAEGRLQYRYHPDWERSRAAVKERGLVRLGEALPRLRRAVQRALGTRQLTRGTVTAAVVRLIDRAHLRVGHEAYATGNGGRGAATLLKTDVDVRGETVVLDFKGKGGKTIHREFEDSALARLLRKLKQLPGKRLFKAVGQDGELQPVSASDVNRYLAKTSGQRITAKGFRTFKASAVALVFLARQEHDDTEDRRAALVEASDRASRLLLNTRAIARSSYIHPKIIRAFEAGKLTDGLLKGRVHSGLTRIEAALLRFLKRPSAN